MITYYTTKSDIQENSSWSFKCNNLFRCGSTLIFVQMKDRFEPSTSLASSRTYSTPYTLFLKPKLLNLVQQSVLGGPLCSVSTVSSRYRCKLVSLPSHEELEFHFITFWMCPECGRAHHSPSIGTIHLTADRR